MLGIRMAGDALRNLDDKYAKAIADMYITDGKKYGDIEGTARAIGAGFLGGIPLSAYNEAPLPAVTGAVVRAAPVVGGITLAGKGIYDLTSAVGTEQTSGTVMP